MLYHFATATLSRAKNESVITRAVYITGRTLKDKMGNTIQKHRDDVIWQGIMLSTGAPVEYEDLQTFAEAMEKAETRRNSRVARQYIMSLPNELPKKIQVEILTRFIREYFVSQGLCAIAAIHEGRDYSDVRNNNPHAHVLVSTRAIESNGFCLHKNRVLDTRSNLIELRKHWAEALNLEYERFHMKCRVSPTKDHSVDREHEYDSPTHAR